MEMIADRLLIDPLIAFHHDGRIGGGAGLAKRERRQCYRANSAHADQPYTAQPQPELQLHQIPPTPWCLRRSGRKVIFSCALRGILVAAALASGFRRSVMQPSSSRPRTSFYSGRCVPGREGAVMETPLGGAESEANQS